MKICIIELMPFPYTLGGGTTHIINLGKSLSELGNEVHVISSRPSKEYEIMEYPKCIKLHNIGMRHKRFKSGFFYYIYRLMFELSFVLGAKRALKKIKPDVIDCQSPITTALPASLSDFPFVITCHGIHSLGFGKLYHAKRKSFVSNYMNKIYKIISKYNIKKTKRIISQGEDTLKHYSKLANDKNKGSVVENMVDTEFWKFSRKKDNKLIVSVARFTKQKSLDKLILAMKLLKDYKLLLVGGGELDKKLRKIAPENVKFLGILDPRAVKKKYSKARFTVLPSEFEGLPYSILESMSSGVIPVSTKVGELKTLIEDGKNGFFLKDNKPKTILKTIQKIQKMNLDKLSESARMTIVERYGSKKVAKQFLEIYKGL